MDISFDLYKIFYYVAKELSFSQAADQLYISQSAVSQSIKALEDKLNCKLFYRHTKQVRLTQEGEMLFQHIEQAFHFIKRGERTIEEIHSLEVGEVRIGASDTICKYYLLPYFERFHRLYPHIKMHVTNRTSPVCIELLKKGSIDVAVVNLPQGFHDKMIEIQDKRTVQDVFIAGDRFHSLKDKTITLQELSNYPLLLLEKNSTTRPFFDGYTKENNVHIAPEIELGSIDLLVELTKIGLGISFVVQEVAEESLKRNEIFLVQVHEKIPSRDLGIITNSSIPIPIAARKFIELLLR
ncbi:MAG: LysR family transcriptional regulator [Bacillota bacterium]